MPDRQEKGPRRDLHIAQLLPNFLTLSALCASLSAVRYAFYGEAQIAVGLIVLAAVLDLLDGWAARALGSESAIGAELDTLADFASFGVAPGLILYFWAVKDELARESASLLWIAVLIYAICCALRLARFNVGTVRATSEGAEKQFFRGVPSPAGALLSFMPIYLSFLMPDAPQMPVWVLAGFLAAVGGLMISRMPTYSFKVVKFRTEHSPYILVAFVVLAGAMLTAPWLTMFGLGIAYAASLVAAARYLRPNGAKAGE